MMTDDPGGSVSLRNLTWVALRMGKEPNGVLYDTVVIFEPNNRWKKTLPVPIFFDGGLEAKLDEVQKKLEEIMARTG